MNSINIHIFYHNFIIIINIQYFYENFNAEIAQKTGVKPGAKLVTCGHDHIAASLGAGMYRAKQMMSEIGTVDFLMMLINEDD
jgi:sugar (pentulose or hexulose) kinase